ncbi:MAG: PKD domain-containing protein [bacterium]|nr:PKD domain-containing protein [bacterium]
MAGRGVEAPLLKLSETALGFGVVEVGASGAGSFTIENPGSAALTVSGISVGGEGAGGFSLSDPPEFPLQIAPGGSARVSVVFAPDTQGEKTAQLSISHNASDAPATLSLSGTAEVVGNPPPQVVGPLEVRTVNVNETAVLSIGEVFRDPGGNPLTFTAMSSNPDTVRIVEVTGEEVRFTAVASGEAVITVTADNGQGGTAATDVSIRVNQLPKVETAILQQELTVGGAPFAQDLEAGSKVFVDPEGDALVYSVNTSDQTVVRVAIAGNGQTLEVHPLQAGTATVNVVANDGNGLTSSSFVVVVVSATPAPANQKPEAVGAISDQNLVAGGEAFVRDLVADPVVFKDSDGDPLTYSAGASDANIVRVGLVGTRLTVTPGGAGTATVSVVAGDGRGGVATLTFAVQVAAPPPENRPPTVVGAIPAIKLTIGDAAFVRDLAADPVVFGDPDGNRLTYRAQSGDESIASVRLSGTTLTVTAVTPGQTTVTVVADDGRGGSTPLNIAVQSAPRPPESPVAAFTAVPTSGTAPLTVMFGDQSSNNPTSHLWDFGEGGSDTGVQPSHTYDTPGTYTVTLTVKNDGGSDVAMRTILVEKPFELPPVEEPAPMVLAEYFADRDPGFGQGVPVALKTATFASAAFDLPTQDLQPGFHTLFVRFKDQRGDWGFARASQFYISPVDEGVVYPLAKMEYFFDGNDPGVGQATPLTVERTVELTQVFELASEGLDNGAHTVTLRAQNAAGNWGLGVSHSFEVNEIGPLDTRPVVVTPIKDQALVAGRDAVVLDLEAEPVVFRAPEGDALTYTVSSSADSVASASLKGGKLSIAPLSEGRAVITVRVDNGSGQPRPLSFGVVVSPDLDAALPLLLGQVQTGSLSSADMRRYYRLSLDSDRDIKINLSSGGKLDAVFSLYRGATPEDAVDENRIGIEIDNESSGEMERLEVFLPEGTYLVEVAAHSGADAYSLRATELRFSDVTIGKRYEGALTEINDLIYYKLTLKTSTFVVFDLTPESDLDLILNVYRGDSIADLVEDNLILDAVDEGISGEPEIVGRELDAGAYVIAVLRYDGTGGYTLALTEDPSQILPDIAVGDRREGRLSDGGGRQYYQLKVLENRLLRVAVTSNDFDARLAIYQASSLRDTSGTWAEANSGEAGAEGIQAVLTKGTYILEVSESEDSGTGAFTLEVGAVDVEAIAPGENKTGALAFPLESDFYRLQLSEAAKLRIDLTSTDADVVLTLRRANDPTGATLTNPLAFNDNFEDGTNARLSLSLVKESYLIEVGARGAGTYDLAVSKESTDLSKRGPVALDLNTETGDQGQNQTNQPLKSGDEVSIDLVATESANNLSGFQVVLSYNPEELQFGGVTVRDLFQGALPLEFSDNGTVTVSAAFLGTGVTPRESGSMAEIRFEVLEGLEGETGISLVSGEFARSTEVQQLDIGSGGAFVTIGGEGGGTGPLSPDFDGDGTVGFRDFVAFAGVFGAQSGDGRYDAKFDLTSSGDIGFSDFILFAMAYGKPVSGKPVLSKVAKGQKPGVNGGAGLLLSALESDRPDEVRVVVDVNSITHVLGYTLRLVYDPAVLAPMEAVGPGGSAFGTLESSGVALQSKPEPGQLLLADVLNPSSALTEAGRLVTLRFRVLDPTAVGRVDVVEGMTSDSKGRLNVLEGAFLEGIRALPTAFGLDQNHPNPFNPVTTITYQLPESGDVALVIYNVLGQQIRTLLHEVRVAGYYHAVWDGKDAFGNQVSSGVYFYRLVSNGHMQTKRMLLLK